MNGKNKIVAAMLTVFIVLFVVSGAVALPLIVRSFYYAQIDGLGIPEATGYTADEAKEAFDEMMDYCMGKSDEFGTGKLAWSEEGKSHFDDCKMLFTLDKTLVVISAIGIVLCVAVAVVLFSKGQASGVEQYSDKNAALGEGEESIENEVEKEESFARGFARRSGFFSGIIMLVVGAALAALGASDFDAFFVKFHHTFFPGKENWLFDPATDEIIKILPEEYFRNCAILIVSVIVLVSVILIVNYLLKRKRAK